MEKEIRNYGTINDYNEGSRVIEGYALKFDSPSQFMGFYEVIDRSAVTEELINKSDIFALFNHDTNRVLARSRYNKGSLKLEIREDGLYYSFEAPNTQWGDEVLEHLKRGEIFGSSFAFCVPEGGDVVERDAEGTLHRTITKIERLFDVSPVFEPAYLSTTCSKRMLELLEECRKEDKKDEEEQEKVDEKVEDKQEDKEDKQEDKQEEKQEYKEDKQEEKQEDQDNQDEEKQEDNQDQENKKEKNIEKKSGNITMEKKFSLLRTIRSIANNQKMDELDAAVVNAGQAEFRKAGVEFGGQIQLPNMLENRAAITVSSEGEDVVATDIYDIMTPLRARNVLVNAGASFMSGLVSNVQVPIMSASNVTWEGEVSPAKDGAGAFTHVTLSPKRLTAYIDISKQFLVQDSIGAEAKIREDLINAINSKLEATILGDGEGSATQPAGMFNGVTPKTIEGFADVADVESDIEQANVLGQIKYVVSPKAKAALRAMIKGENGTGMVYDGESVDGTPALVSSNVAAKKYVVGDWSNLAIGQWGAIDLTVDPYTKAADGQVRLVINAFFDAKVLRSEAFGYGQFE